MIYFDNAATTFPKPSSVTKEVERCIKKYCGNSGRGAHSLSLKTGEKIYEARERIASHIGATRSENVVFTQNATHALNMAIKLMVNDGAHVIISNMEHNSVLRPVYSLNKNRGVEYSLYDLYGDPYEEIPKLIKENTECIISTLTSNVNGKTVDFVKLSDVATKYGIKLIIDASQYIGHKRIDLKKTPCDALCAPGHKALFGIQGSGFVYFKNGEFEKTFMEGGSGNESRNPDMPSELPERYEAGTLASPAVISIGCGISFIESVGIESIENKLSGLTDTCVDILSHIDGICLYGGENGVVSFNITTIPAYVISDELNKLGVCTRSGLHCAPLAHGRIGTPESGSVRISFSYFNKKSELDRFYKELLYIKKKYL